MGPFLRSLFFRILIAERIVIRVRLLFFFFFFGRSMQNFPNQALKPHSLHWKCSLNHWATGEVPEYFLHST